MPVEYEKLVAALVGKQGKTLKEAKSEGAAIFNHRHPNDPLSNYVKAEKKGKKTK